MPSRARKEARPLSFMVGGRATALEASLHASAKVRSGEIFAGFPSATCDQRLLESHLFEDKRDALAEVVEERRDNLRTRYPNGEESVGYWRLLLARHPTSVQLKAVDQYIVQNELAIHVLKEHLASQLLLKEHLLAVQAALVKEIEGADPYTNSDYEVVEKMLKAGLRSAHQKKISIEDLKRLATLLEAGGRIRDVLSDEVLSRISGANFVSEDGEKQDAVMAENKALEEVAEAQKAVEVLAVEPALEIDAAVPVLASDEASDEALEGGSGDDSGGSLKPLDHEYWLHQAPLPEGYYWELVKASETDREVCDMEVWPEYKTWADMRANDPLFAEETTEWYDDVKGGVELELYLGQRFPGRSEGSWDVPPRMISSWYVLLAPGPVKPREIEGFSQHAERVAIAAPHAGPDMVMVLRQTPAVG